jgi:hypothetical protein
MRKVSFTQSMEAQGKSMTKSPMKPSRRLSNNPESTIELSKSPTNSKNTKMKLSAKKITEFKRKWDSEGKNLEPVMRG